MRYAIISDIHSNLPALKVVLERIEDLQCDRVICLGDIVGYGPFPNECCDLIQERADMVIVGNHDHAVIGQTDISYFNTYARRAIEWTRTMLSEMNKNYLFGLPAKVDIEKACCVHSTPEEPLEWHYIMSSRDAAISFNYFEQQVCFIGHSHVPLIAKKNTDQKINVSLLIGTVEWSEDERCIINVGSVGQPRDGNPDACLGVYEPAQNRFTLERIEYEITETQKKMREYSLPGFLISRLSWGK